MSTGTDAAADPFGAGSVIMMAAGVSGPVGTYAATPLTVSSDWQVGLQSGDFAYTYKLPEPPAISGTAPGLAANYSSSSVDGQTTADNSQSSWAGNGWDLQPGFVERSYGSCSQDGHPTWGTSAG